MKVPDMLRLPWREKGESQSLSRCWGVGFFNSHTTKRKDLKISKTHSNAENLNKSTIKDIQQTETYPSVKKQTKKKKREQQTPKQY